MKRLIHTLLIFFVGGTTLHAAAPALFGTVIHVAKDDVLNVRAQPDYRSRKLGAFPNGAHIYIDRCRPVGRSRWCHIHPDPLVDYGGAAGWVNAKFLREDNLGYVQIKGRENGCYVSLKCRRGKCLVVTGLPGEETTTGLKTEWIPRSRLVGTNKFGAKRDEGDGYCTMLYNVDEYLGKQRLKAKGKSFADPAYDTARKMIAALSDKDLSTILSLIHPTRGIRLSERTHFGSNDDKLFTRKLFRTYWKNNQPLDWGHTSGRGDLIQKDLWHYIHELALDPASINHVSKLGNRLRGFPGKGSGTLRGYSFRHTNPHSRRADYDWQGIVVILAPYQGRWYVAGMLRDRWTV